jgi:hypothetical protein
MHLAEGICLVVIPSGGMGEDDTKIGLKEEVVVIKVGQCRVKFCFVVYSK